MTGSPVTSALLDAAMALGAPDLLEPNERDCLLAPFLVLEALSILPRAFSEGVSGV